MNTLSLKLVISYTIFYIIFRLQNLIKHWAGRVHNIYEKEKEKDRKQDIIQSNNKFDVNENENQCLFFDLTALENEIFKKFDRKGVEIFLELFDKKYDEVREFKFIYIKVYFTSF